MLKAIVKWFSCESKFLHEIGGWDEEGWDEGRRKEKKGTHLIVDLSLLFMK